MIGLVAYLLVIVDYLLTKYLVMTGLAIEGNPILKTVFDSNLYLLVLAIIGLLIYLTMKVKVNPKIYRLFYLVIVSRIAVIMYSIGVIIHGCYY